jgi:hypothetical protein
VGVGDGFGVDVVVGTGVFVGVDVGTNVEVGGSGVTVGVSPIVVVQADSINNVEIITMKRFISWMPPWLFATFLFFIISII